MKAIVSIAAAGTLALALGACGETELQKAQEQQPQPVTSTQAAAGTPFSQSLNRYYLEASQSQWTGQKDFFGSEHLAKKAQATGQGLVVAPDTLAERGPAIKKGGELTESRARFMSAMSRDAATKIPEETARAQVAYDCWLEEAADPVQAVESKWLEGKVRNCRKDFYEAMAKVDEVTKPTYVIFFNNDSATVSDAGLQTLREAAAFAREDHVIRVNVVGNADRTGTPEYNQALSEKRAKEVERILTAAGVGKNLIAAEGRGENDPQVATADGVPEPQNRNVTIILDRKY